MQFDYHKEIGTDYATVTFTGHLYRLPVKAHNSLMNVLEKLGGIVDHEVNSCEFKFPSFVSSIVIAQVIHNTCFECGGLMGNGIAIQNGVLKAPGDRESSICYTPYVDPNNHSVINVRKCTVCGHSHT